MQLIFHDRRKQAVAPPTREAWLTIERKGAFCLSVGAVSSLRLASGDELILAQDADTNNWFLLLEPAKPFEAFTLRPRDSSNTRALMFTCQPQARAYYDAHGLAELRSVRAVIGLEPVAVEGLTLYPLLPQHATKAPAAAVAASAEVVAEQPVVVQESVTTPDVVALPTDLPQLQPEPTTPPMAVSAPAPSPGALPESRVEQLTDFWYEREINTIKEEELTELLQLLGNKPKQERDIVENIVLGRAKTERAKREKLMAKKGGNRG